MIFEYNLNEDNDRNKTINSLHIFIINDFRNIVNRI